MRGRSIVMGLALLGAACAGGVPVSTDLALVDRAAELGVQEAGRTWGVAVLDFDGDGSDDFFFTYHAPGKLEVRLYLNTGDGFELHEPTVEDFPPRDRHGCAWGDITGNGELDAYCPVGADEGRGSNPNEVWIRQADSSLIDEARERGATDDHGRGRHALLVDLDGDGALDLVVTNDTRTDGRPSDNRAFRNDDGRFEAVPSGLEVAEGGHCLAAGDVDGDGLVDVYICSNQRPHLFHNEGGLRFADRSREWNLPRTRVLDAIFVDLDGNGQDDLVQATLDEVVVQYAEDGRLGPPRTLHRLGRDARGQSRRGNVRLAAGDANGNGHQDVYVLVSRHACDAADLPDAPDVLLLNDGEGGIGSLVVSPEVTGCGNAVAAIDIDGDGTHGFVVLNGWRAAEGPVQILELVRR